MENRPEEFDDHSEHVREVLSSMPKGILRYGSLIVFVFLLIFIGIASIIRFPDVLVSPIILSSKNLPLKIKPNQDGKLVFLFSEDNKKVKEGEILAVFASSTSYSDVLSLDSMIRGGSSIDSVKIKYDQVQLGEIQKAYNDYINSYNESTLYETTKPENKLMQSYINQKSKYLNLIDQQHKQEALLFDEVSLVYNELERTKKLFDAKVISKQEYESKASIYLQSQRSIEALRESISNSEIALAEIEGNILLQKVEDGSQKIRYNTGNITATNALRSSIEEWKQKYLLYAPINGIISYFNYRPNNSFVSKDEELFSIVPDSLQEVIGIARPPALNSGKLKLGQRVIVKLDGYPYQEFGTISGTVSNISLVNRNESYSVIVNFKDPKTTSFRNEIILRPEMQGTAEIVTMELSILQRLFYQFRNVWAESR